MNDADLLALGRQMRSLVYPLTYDGKPSVSAFSIQLEEAGAEWRRRNRKVLISGLLGHQVVLHVRP
jgi:hypothetical protein